MNMNVNGYLDFLTNPDIAVFSTPELIKAWAWLFEAKGSAFLQYMLAPGFLG